MTIRFHARDALGLGAPVSARLSTRSAFDAGAGHRGLTRHWVGDGGTLFHPDPVQRLRNIWHYHVDTLHYGDIAYNGAFDSDGNTYGLRDARYVSAHAGSTNNEANRTTDGIVWLEDKRGWTPACTEAFTWWHNLYALFHHRQPVEYDHNWWSKGHGGLPTQCSGPESRRVLVFTHGNV